MKKRIIIGMTGASGAIYGIRLLESLQSRGDAEVHLIISKPAERTIIEETDYKVDQIKKMAHVCHPPGDVGASIASGSFVTAGMIVVPCSIHTMSAIAYCQADNLVTRAADVVLKEQRKLVLVVRETPFHRGHLKAMLEASEAGAVILPPVPAFYTRPKTVDDIINHTIGRILDHFGIEQPGMIRWGDSTDRT